MERNYAQGEYVEQSRAPSRWCKTHFICLKFKNFIKCSILFDFDPYNHAVRLVVSHQSLSEKTVAKNL